MTPHTPFFRLLLLLLLTLAIAACAAAASPPHATDAPHELILAVRQRNLAVVEAKLLDVSDPASARYGQHMTYDAIGALTRDADAQAATRAWLAAYGIDACTASAHGAFLTCTAAASTWQRALGGGHHDLLRDEIARPAAVRGHLAGIFRARRMQQHARGQSNGRPAVRPARAFPTGDAAGYCTKWWTCPNFLHHYYNISTASGPPPAPVLGSQSVFETGQYASAKDLAQFQHTYGTPAVKVAKDVNGFMDDDTCEFLNFECSEANLDLQYITAIGERVPTWFWGNNKQTTFANWITSVAGTKDAPLVHSVSYGQLESQTGPDLRSTFTTEVQKLGLRGISVVVSSGDDGVGNKQTETSEGLCGYTPQWPAACPYVTTVGATQGPEEGTGREEVVCSSSHNNTFITSGGGFSEAYATPAYQKNAVAGFLANASQNSLGPGFNQRGRGYPDVAMIGHLYPTVNGGGLNVVDGTSASTPVVAGILALVNARRLAQNKSSVGFANPALYNWAGNAAIFRDITSGQNNCAAGGWQGSTVVCCPDNGFHAVKGWDPASGLGSINVGNLLDVWEELP